MSSEFSDQDAMNYLQAEDNREIHATATPAVPLKCFLLYVSGIILFFMATIGSYQFADETESSYQAHRQLLSTSESSHNHHVDTSTLYQHVQHALDVDYAHLTDIVTRAHAVQSELDKFTKEHERLEDVLDKLTPKEEKLKTIQTEETNAAVGEDDAGVSQSNDHASISQALHSSLSGITARVHDIQTQLISGKVQITSLKEQLKTLKKQEEAVNAQTEADQAALAAAQIENNTCSFEHLNSAHCAFPKTIHLSAKNQQHTLTVLDPPAYISLDFTKFQAFECDVELSLGVNRICDAADKQRVSNATDICRVDMEVESTSKHPHHLHHCTKCLNAVFDLAALDRKETPKDEEPPATDEDVSKACLIYRKRAGEKPCTVVTDISFQKAEKELAVKHVSCSKKKKHKPKQEQNVTKESETSTDEKPEESSETSAAWHNQGALYWSVVASFIAVVTGSISLFFIIH